MFLTFSSRCCLPAPSRSETTVLPSGFAEISRNTGCKHTPQVFIQNQNEEFCLFLIIFLMQTDNKAEMDPLVEINPQMRPEQCFLEPEQL